MSKLLRVSTAVAVLALFIYSVFSPYTRSAKETISSAIAFINTPSPEPLLPFTCQPHTYSTEIVSLDPLVIYIDSFVPAREVSALLEAGEPEFRPSTVVKRGQKQQTHDRTSQSAGLPLDSAAVRCVLDRAERFMGSMLDPARDEIGPPQLVRYTEGQRFNIHHDWYETPQPVRSDKRDRGRSWNRVASFFAVLEDGCTGGETHFPYVKPIAPRRKPTKGGSGMWWEHEDGGIAFKPISGNAIFWVNLFANGTGDERVMHAGLPLGGGMKTAMNIWPRQYYP
jgi:prolyl 4-hydroxylase